MKLIECVPNISEGRNKDIINKIIEPLKNRKNVYLLDVDSGYDTNRTVITFIGSPENVIDAAFELIENASKFIDMSLHEGEHSRMGATDVCPLIPVTNTTMKECVKYSKELAKRVANKLQIPVFLYEHSATNKERKNLANIRKGEYEGMFEKIQTKNWYPDYGKSENNTKSGVVAIGAREFLIAYNINLNTSDKKIATDIALDIREAGRAKRDSEGKIIRDKNKKIVKKPGKLKFCKAVGWYIDEYNQAQVSINLTNYKRTSIHKTFEEVRKQARKRGVRVTGSEIVGLVPKASLLSAGRYYLKKQHRSTSIPENNILNIAIQSLGLSDINFFNKDKKIIENIISKDNESLNKYSVSEFMDILSEGTPTPGGGSVSALAGSLSMALTSMVSNLSFQKKGLENNKSQYTLIGDLCQQYKKRMLELIELDALAYDEVINAFRLPKKNEKDIKIRKKAINVATIHAANIPLNILELSINWLNQINKMVSISNPNSISDLGVANYMAFSASQGAYMNVLINANDFENKSKKREYVDKIDYYSKQAEDLFIKNNDAIKIELSNND